MPILIASAPASIKFFACDTVTTATTRKGVVIVLYVYQIHIVYLIFCSFVIPSTPMLKTVTLLPTRFSEWMGVVKFKTENNLQTIDRVISNATELTYPWQYSTWTVQHFVLFGLVCEIKLSGTNHCLQPHLFEDISKKERELIKFNLFPMIPFLYCHQQTL